MSTLDPNRATFVRNQFRDYEAVEPAVNARNNDAARTVSIVTNLSGAEAQALADKTLAAMKNPAVAFQMEFEGTFEADSMVGQCPTALVTIPKFKTKDRLMRMQRIRTDYETNSTTVEVRG